MVRAFVWMRNEDNSLSGNWNSTSEITIAFKRRFHNIAPKESKTCPLKLFSNPRFVESIEGVEFTYLHGLEVIQNKWHKFFSLKMITMNYMSISSII